MARVSRVPMQSVGAAQRPPSRRHHPLAGRVPSHAQAVAAGAKRPRVRVGRTSASTSRRRHLSIVRRVASSGRATVTCTGRPPPQCSATHVRERRRRRAGGYHPSTRTRPQLSSETEAGLRDAALRCKAKRRAPWQPCCAPRERPRAAEESQAEQNALRAECLLTAHPSGTRHRPLRRSMLRAQRHAGMQGTSARKPYLVCEA